MKPPTQMFHHPKVALLCVTGGPMVVAAASKYGKRVIAAGPGNPPVVVDQTADLDLAARCIIEGAAFDNNLLCIGEKEVFVVASVASAFMDAMRRAGGFELNKAAIERLTKAAFTFEGDGKGCARAHVQKELVGKDVAVLAAAAGVQRSGQYADSLRRDGRGPCLRRRGADDAFHSGGARVVRGRGHQGGGEGGARLPAHGHHSLQGCGRGDAHGARHEHDDLCAATPRRWRRWASAGRDT